MQLTSSEIKRLHSLAQKKFRDELEVFTVEGEKGVCEALSSEFKVREAYYTPEAEDCTARRIEKRFPDSEIPMTAMERISQLASPSPALAVVEMKPRPSSDQIGALISGHPLCLALDGVRDPGNLGTIIRIADWFGIDAVFASADTCELYNPKTVQASMGSIFRKEFIRCDLSTLCGQFISAGMDVFGTFLDGQDLRVATGKESFGDRRASGLIVMGSESHGISDAVGSLVSRRLLIPPYPADSRPTDSLNVAMATAIICYAFREERLPLPTRKQ